MAESPEKTPETAAEGHISQTILMLPVPPLAETVALPFVSVHVSSAFDVVKLIAVGCPIITLEAVVSQLLASFTLIW